jgi:hypothetical protein
MSWNILTAIMGEIRQMVVVHVGSRDTRHGRVKIGIRRQF